MEGDFGLIEALDWKNSDDFGSCILGADDATVEAVKGEKAGSTFFTGDRISGDLMRSSVKGRETPKSHKRTLQSGLISTFDGLRSRWISPVECR